ncbi:DUF6622 family protein [Lelliottia amnigena]|uniref:DUF6622 family protein n=1 Tax=Lelliottia amnigena TaxID=61646 RepID=UPI0040566A2A
MPSCVIMTGCIDATTVKPMMETLPQILTHTPVWVWILFVFLITRGIKARQPATVTLEKLAIIPAIFLIWDIYDLVMHRQLTLSTFALWIAGILAGAALGYVLSKHVSATRAAAPRSIHRQADYSALPFMMLAFLVKYALGVMTAMSPETLQQPGMSAFAIISGGVFAGVFLGKFIRYLGVYFSGAPQQAG